MVQIHKYNLNKALFAIFVGFKNAFPSVPHIILWKKLHASGISSKIINILIDFYKIANICILTKNGKSESVNVSKGVLQGETLSPLLFTLFVNDLEEFLIKEGCRGILINKIKAKFLFAYADDLVLFVDTPWKCARKLKVLSKHCEEFRLTVNTSKTKVKKIIK